jgi:hypothetical protein
MEELRREREGGYASKGELGSEPPRHGRSDQYPAGEISTGSGPGSPI